MLRGLPLFIISFLSSGVAADHTATTSSGELDQIEAEVRTAESAYLVAEQTYQTALKKKREALIDQRIETKVRAWDALEAREEAASDSFEAQLLLVESQQELEALKVAADAYLAKRRQQLRVLEELRLEALVQHGDALEARGEAESDRFEYDLDYRAAQTDVAELTTKIDEIEKRLAILRTHQASRTGSSVSDQASITLPPRRMAAAVSGVPAIDQGTEQNERALAVQTLINLQRPRITDSCRKEARAEQANGRVQLALTLNPDGVVQWARVANSTTHMPALDQCLVRQFAVLRFPLAHEGSTHEAVFIFSSSE